MDVRIRFLDHRVSSDGDSAYAGRIIERLIPPCAAGADYMLHGLHFTLTQLIDLEMHGLEDRYPVEDFAQMKTLRLSFETALPDGLHWAHSEVVRYKDPAMSMPIAMHPYPSVLGVTDFGKMAKYLLKTNPIPLERAEVYMGKILVLPFSRSNQKGAVPETFPYTIPVDPLLVA
ncbi:hypothetical protein CC86DRAFT_376733 [Ophiobolus disseminans]|uniref:Uncharacterized protein n=1 Tax=Ophiobolus disseminans TaxID=1469910 RepID=A0A6A7AKB8_9PLEO|nr:hypothetical protein CC86DRAFT_376733 [Ophiobolus disseminans]